MNYHLNNDILGSAEVLRFSLRIRRYMLPFFITAATIVLILTDEVVNPKSIILNFLAISFISEADNIIAKIFLGNDQNARMERITSNVDQNMLNARSDLLWIRIQGFFCAVVLCVFVFTLIKGEENCQTLQDSLRILTEAIPLGFFLVHSCYTLCCTRREVGTMCKRFMIVLIDFFCNMISWSIALIVSYKFEYGKFHRP